MKKTLFIILVTFILLLFLLLACEKAPKVTERDGELSFFVPRDPPTAAYILKVNFDIKDQTVILEGIGQVDFRNSSGKKMTSVAFEGGGSSFELFFDGRKLSSEEVDPIGEGVRFFSLPKEIKPHEKLSFDLKFSLHVNPQDNGDIFLRRWYPKLWWDGLPTRDSFKVKVEVPSGYKLASSGCLNPETGYYENPGVTTNFGLILFRDINVEERDADGVLIKSFYKDKGKKCALLCLETAVDVIKFYKELHGFFPFSSLNIVPGIASPVGGYPFASALVIIHGQQAFNSRPELHWKWITAHEIGHQYWGEYVMSDEEKSYTESWLMIGMGIMADRFYVEKKKLPDDKHDEFFNRYLKGVEKGFDTTTDAPETLRRQQKYDRNNILIHGKGYAIVSALRNVIGDDVFKKVYLRSIEEFGGKRMNYRDLERMAEEESGENLDWFFDQWVRSSDYLCYRIVSADCRKEEEKKEEEEKQEDKRSQAGEAGSSFITEIVVEKMGDSMGMPVEVMAVFKDGSSQIKRTSRFLWRNTLFFRSNSELKDVVLDPSHQLAILNKLPPINMEDLKEKVEDMPYTGARRRGLELYKSALELDCKDYKTWFKLGLVIFEGGYFDEAFTCFEKILELDAPENYHFIATTWQGNVRDAQGRRDEAIGFYKKALEMAEITKLQVMRHDQWGIKISREWVERRLVSPFDWKSVVKR